MVQVVVIDECGRVVEKYNAEIKFQEDAVITMNPGVPPLGSAAFTAWLADWNGVHNPNMVEMK